MDKSPQFEDYGGLLHVDGKPTPLRKLGIGEYSAKTENGFTARIHHWGAGEIDDNSPAEHVFSAEHEPSGNDQVGHYTRWGKDSHHADSIFTTVRSHADIMDRLKRTSMLPGGSKPMDRRNRLEA